jgi:pyridoxine kinase
MAQAFAAMDALHKIGPGTVMVTSMHTDETPADCLDLLTSDPKGRFRVRTPKLPLQLNGAGDAIAALFTAHYLHGGSAGEALSRAASAVYGLLCKTLEAGSREILLVAAQDELVKPSRLFEAEKLGR